MTYYLGVDPGKRGAIALLSTSGRIVSVHDMPLVVGQKASGHYDPPEILALLRRLLRVPDVQVEVEWPQTRPGEGAQRSRNFGLGLGYLEMALVALGARWQRVDPQKWKNRLGLPGKTDPDAMNQARDLFNLYFPDQQDLILGPRGGLLDGRMEAVLIAEAARRRTFGGLKATAERFGKDSVEAHAMVLGAGGRRRMKAT